MKDEIEQLIPLIKNGKIPASQIQQITNRIRESIREDSSNGKELGELLSRVKKAAIAKDLHTEINWVKIGNGFLAIGHKPGKKISFQGLKNEGTSAVLTLLNENEGAAAIGRQLQTVDIEWIHFPFSASKPHAGEAVEKVYRLYTQLSNLVFAGYKIYIHCSAGIHRTGMITYGFLRFIGMRRTEAFELLQTLREVTASQVGDQRLVWADQFGDQQYDAK